MDKDNEQLPDDYSSESNEQAAGAPPAAQKRLFVEPSVSAPVKVLEATRLLLQTTGAAGSSSI
ncbi:MAG: hypothetical protein ABR577_11560 [Pyrinomonadaceae bacterium]